MARKFRKRTSRIVRRKGVKNGRRLQVKNPGQSKISQYMRPLKRTYNSITGTEPRKKARRPRISPFMPPNAAVIKASRGLSIGTSRPLTFREKVMSISNPPVSFNSKWIFQMDCISAFFTAASIPILTQPLLSPLVKSLYTDGVSDVTSVTPPTLAADGAPYAEQYSVMIHEYLTRLRF